MTDDVKPMYEKGRDLDPETGLFIKGKKGGPGRPRGCRAILGETFLEKMLDDFEEYGKSVIEKVRIDRPHEYLKVIAATLPKDITLNLNPMDDLTDDQLVTRIRQLDNAIRPFLAAAGSGDAEDGGETSTRH